MDTTHCIINTDWERYAAKELAAKELQALQAHATGCELCRDIKEGIDAMAEPATLKVKVAAINADADKYLQRGKPRRMLVWYWSSAAAVVIAFGLGFLLLNKADEQITASGVNNPPAAVFENAYDSAVDREEIAPMKKDRPAPLADNFKSNNSPVADIEISSTLGNQVIADEAVEKPEVRYKPENRGLSKDLNEKEANKVTEEEETDFLISDFSGSARDTLQKEIIASATLSETKKKTATLPAPNYMSNNGAFSNATLNANGVNHYFSWDFADSAEYGRAVAHYDSAAYDSCILTIKRVTELPASYYYEDGLLLKAKALIKQGKKKEAKKVLKSVIALNGARKMEAEGLLNTLK